MHAQRMVTVEQSVGLAFEMFIRCLLTSLGSLLPKEGEGHSLHVLKSGSTRSVDFTTSDLGILAVFNAIA